MNKIQKQQPLLKSQHIFFIIALYLVAFVIVFERPLDVQQWQWADDALYFNNAKAIINNFGETSWLGPFTEILLSKAPFFPVFIAFSISSGIPLRLLEFLLYAPLPFFFILAINPLKLPLRPILFISIFCLLFIPTAGMALRLVRTTVFGAMALYSLIFMTALVVYVATQQKKAWIWALLTGLCIGLAATTRAEGIWLFGPASLAIVTVTFFYWQQKWIVKSIAVLLFLIVGYLIPLTAFSSLNYKSYGIYSPSLRQHQSYKDFYSLLSSIEPNKRSRYVPISTEVRALIYSYSPKFAELRPFLEGQSLDNMAKNAAHHRLNGWGNKLNIREFFVSNFEFALAKAIFLSGRTTASDFINFCENTNEELQFAIYSGKITAGSKGIGLLPPLPISDIPQVMNAAYRSINLLLWPPESIKRQYSLKPNPVIAVASDWHAMLGTSPGNSNTTVKRFPDTIFNKWLINIFKVSYGLTVLMAIILLIISLRKEQQRGPVLLTLMMIATGGVFAFSTVMGIIDTIAWPILRWAKGYNSMGMFPLHYLLLVSFVVILHCIHIYRPRNKVMIDVNGVETVKVSDIT